MKNSTFSEQLWQGLGEAIADIRQKVIEEPMYGRAVTDGPEGPQWPDARQAEQSFGSISNTRETEPEIDLDR
jgi:hypothetical protein